MSSMNKGGQNPPNESAKRPAAPGAGRTNPETIEEQITGLRTDLILAGFLAAKRISQLQGRTAGEMPCPLCQQTLHFRYAPNGHFAACCETEQCINAME